MARDPNKDNGFVAKGRREELFENKVGYWVIPSYIKDRSKARLRVRENVELGR